jgi:hypothetical protein
MMARHYTSASGTTQSENVCMSYAAVAHWDGHMVSLHRSAQSGQRPRHTCAIHSADWRFSAITALRLYQHRLPRRRVAT